jgi:hypothetical protein
VSTPFEDFDLDEPVEVRPGEYLVLRDCGPEDLDSAMELLGRRAIRNQAGRDRFLQGQTPLCDWMDGDGMFCERAADFVNIEAGRWICERHRKQEEAL